MLWLLLIILLICSGCISASETALFGLSRQSLVAFGASPHRGRRLVHHLMRHPRRVLMVILITNTAVNVSIFTVSVFAIAPYRESLGYAAALVDGLVPIMVIIFGEMLPKALALTNSELLAPVAGGIVQVLQMILGPLQWVLARWVVDPVIRLVSPTSSMPDGVSTDELKLLVEHSAHEGVITSDENDMLQAIVSLEDVSVREVMTPRVDIYSIPANAPRGEVMDLFRSSKMRQVPVFERNLDSIRGFLQVRDLLIYPDKPMVELLQPTHFVPEQINLMQLLHHFLEEKIRIAIVVDEFGGTSGLVTNEDVVEWIVGELPTEEAVKPALEAEKIDDQTYRLPGNLSARLWAERFSVDGITGRFDTVGGLILSRLGHWPRVGDRVQIQNLTLTVDRMQRRRIDRVVVHHDPGISMQHEQRNGEEASA